MTWRIDEYRTAAGETPVGPSSPGFRQTPRRRRRTDQAGRGARQQLREPHSKALGDGLFELRRNQVRLFYMFEPGQTIRLLGGMVKKQDRIPSDVLAQMRGYQKDAREWLKKANTEKKR